MDFTLADVYAHAGALAKLHPNNAHVRPKIRQQFQIQSLSRRFRSGGPFTLSVVEVRPPRIPRLRFTPSAVEGLLPFTLVPSAQSTTIRSASELATTQMSANTLLV